MITDLTFAYNGKAYASQFICTSSNQIVQISLERYGALTVRANIADMEPTDIKYFYNSKNLIFNLNVPAGMNITILSSEKVVSAKVFTE